MKAKIVNVYNDHIITGKGLKGGWGESFHITVEDREILFDVGYKRKTFMNNVLALGIDVNKIEKLVLSHAHSDHTGGLPSILEARTGDKVLPIIAHPSVLEHKSLKISIAQWPIGLPKLKTKLLKKIDFQLTKSPSEILPKLSTTGEISMAERTEKPGIAKRAFHKVNGHSEFDPSIEDLSLILDAKDGLVILTGCCHAGILNTCAKATKLYNKRIKTIVGGTHMMEYSNEDVEHVGDILEKIYGSPELYLNHCTGQKATEQLRKRFGSDIVRDCFVGTELNFEIL